MVCDSQSHIDVLVFGFWASVAADGFSWWQSRLQFWYRIWFQSGPYMNPSITPYVPPPITSMEGVNQGGVTVGSEPESLDSGKYFPACNLSVVRLLMIYCRRPALKNQRRMFRVTSQISQSWWPYSYNEYMNELMWAFNFGIGNHRECVLV